MEHAKIKQRREAREREKKEKTKKMKKSGFLIYGVSGLAKDKFWVGEKGSKPGGGGRSGRRI